MICISSCNFKVPVIISFWNTLSISWLLILYFFTWLKPFIIKYKDWMIFVFGLVHGWNMMAPPKQLIKSQWFRHQIACLCSQMVKKRGQKNRGAYSSGHSLPLHGLIEKVYHQIVMRFCFKYRQFEIWGGAAWTVLHWRATLSQINTFWLKI